MSTAHVWITGEEDNLIEIETPALGYPKRIVEDAAWKALHRLRYPFDSPLHAREYTRNYWLVRDAVRIVATVRWPVLERHTRGVGRVGETPADSDCDAAQRAWWATADREYRAEYDTLHNVLSSQSSGKGHDARLQRARERLLRAMARHGEPYPQCATTPYWARR